jgi:hypothetical protein
MNNLYYKVVETYPDDNNVVVRYWTDMISELELASDEWRNDDGTPKRCRSDVSLNLPIPAPTGKDLEDLFVKSGPVEWLKMLEKVKDPQFDTSLSNVTENYLNVTKSITEIDYQKVLDPNWIGAIPPQPDPTYVYNPTTNTWEAP